MKVETKEDEIQSWWKHWWNADYTWDGLARIALEEVHISGAQNLQEYWRFSPTGRDSNGEICWEGPLTDRQLIDRKQLFIGADGTLWHIAHLPIVDANGNELDLKAFRPGVGAAHSGRQFKQTNWNAFMDDARSRLVHSEYTDVVPAGEFEDLKSEVDGRALFKGVVFLEADFGQQSLANLADQNIAVAASFYQSAFLGNSNFNKSKFSSAINFGDTLWTGERVNFFATQLKGADFTLSRVFCRIFRITRADLLESELFFEEAIIDATIFSVERITNCCGLSFESARANATMTHISRNAISARELNFENFSGVGRVFNLRGTECSGSAMNFRASILDYDEITLSKSSCMGRLLFQRAVFKGHTDFSEFKFPAGVASYQNAFARATFGRSVNFTGVSELPISAFADVIFEGAVYLEHRYPKAEKKHFQQMLKEIKQALRTDELAVNDDSYVYEVDAERLNRMSEARYSALERGCQTFKKIFEERSDKNGAMRFFSFELEARSLRSSEKLASRPFVKLYRLLSDCGSSLWRPLAFLSGLTFSSTLLIYAILNDGIRFKVGGQADLLGLSRCLGAAFKNIVKPFDVWRRNWGSGEDSWLVQWLVGEPLDSGIFLFVSSLQSILSLVLLFLFGLAVRRRFQLS